jgi:HemY protein
MVRILFFILFVLALALGFAWLADRPGELSLIWQGQRIEMSLMRAASILISLFAIILIAIWLIRAIWQSPHTVTRFFRARKRDRGYQALSTGLIAAGAGDALLARKMAARTRSLIRMDQEPLIHLLEAQTALIEGKHDDARRKFELMADDPETRELGLRGLYLEAKRLGAHEAARQYAERAAEKAPHLPWAALATLDHRSQAGQWDEAIHLLDQSRAANVLDKKEANRKKAVLLTARAMSKLEANPKSARDDALAALKLEERLAPAALVAAKALFREDNLRKGASILEKMWKVEPHPEVARLYVRARGGDSAVDRLKRAKRLESLRGNNTIALAAVAEAALEARELALARQKAEAAARLAPTESIFMLLADVEEADTGDEGRIRHWMAQALRSPRDPAWTADGVISPSWLPVSPVSGRLDAFEWKAPPSQLSATTQEGDLNADEAIRSLPPVTTVEPATTAETPEPSKAERPAAAPQTEQAASFEVPEREEATAESKQPVGEEEPAPFFGRRPDDPGVRDLAAEEKDKASFRLF